jgi:hypothetical protein
LHLLKYIIIYRTIKMVRGVGFEPTQAYATGTSTLPL